MSTTARTRQQTTTPPPTEHVYSVIARSPHALTELEIIQASGLRPLRALAAIRRLNQDSAISTCCVATARGDKRGWIVNPWRARPR